MAINTLKDVKEIDGNKVMTNLDRPLDDKGNVDWNAFDELRKTKHICVDHETNMISFKMMVEPASKGGSGCQLTSLVETAVIMLEYFNGKLPCPQNDKTILYWKSGLNCQKERIRDREKRNVEGKDEL